MKSQQQTTAGTNDDEVGNPSDDPEGQLPSTSKAGQSTSSLGINRGGGGRQGDQRTSSRSTNGKSTSLSSESGSSTLGPTSGRSSTSSWWVKIFSFDFDLLIHFEVLKVEMDLIWWYFRVSVELREARDFTFSSSCFIDSVYLLDCECLWREEVKHHIVVEKSNPPSLFLFLEIVKSVAICLMFDREGRVLSHSRHTHRFCL